MQRQTSGCLFFQIHSRSARGLVGLQRSCRYPPLYGAEVTLRLGKQSG